MSAPQIHGNDAKRVVVVIITTQKGLGGGDDGCY